MSIFSQEIGRVFTCPQEVTRKITPWYSMTTINLVYTFSMYLYVLHFQTSQYANHIGFPLLSVWINKHRTRTAGTGQMICKNWGKKTVWLAQYRAFIYVKPIISFLKSGMRPRSKVSIMILYDQIIPTRLQE